MADADEIKNSEEKEKPEKPKKRKKENRKNKRTQNQKEVRRNPLWLVFCQK